MFMTKVLYVARPIVHINFLTVESHSLNWVSLFPLFKFEFQILTPRLACSLNGRWLDHLNFWLWALLFSTL